MDAYSLPESVWPHFDENKGKFFNPSEFESWKMPNFISAFRKLRMFHKETPDVESIRQNVVNGFDKEAFKAHSRGILVCWIGHSSCLIKINSFVFLCDPVWGPSAGPRGFGPKRYVKAPFGVSDLPPIDFVLISHNHYDHMEERTIRDLGNSTHWIVPLGNGRILKSFGIKDDFITELDWFENHDFNVNCRIVCTPCQHWSKRTVNDSFKSLWCSFVVQSLHEGSGRVFSFVFVGDSGFCPVAFNAIYSHLGEIDVGAIPIGCYLPRDFLGPQHMAPEESVATHELLHCSRSFGIHWGTYAMGARELPSQPPVDLQKELEGRSLPLSCFATLKHGEVVLMADVPSEQDASEKASSVTDEAMEEEEKSERGSQQLNDVREGSDSK